MKKNWILIPAALGMMLLILDAKNSAAAAAGAVEVCIRTVIPSLFPFFVLSGYLTRHIPGGKWIAKLFCSDRSSGNVILTGLLGGYPVGAKAAAQGYRNESLTRTQANRLLFFCSQAGPSFLFGMVAAQFDNPGYAWTLWGIQILSALTVARLIPVESISERTATQQPAESDPMHSALQAMGAVCGWVIIFSILIRFLEHWVFWLLPEEVRILFCGILELTSGCLMLPQIQDISLRFLLAAVMLNFGGVCVLLQTGSVIQDLKLKNYLMGKLLQTAVSIFYGLMVLGIWHAAVPVFLVLLVKILHNPGKRSSIPLENGV